jgi:hypothetical protein
MKLLVIGSGMMGSAAAYERDVPPKRFSMRSNAAASRSIIGWSRAREPITASPRLSRRVEED